MTEVFICDAVRTPFGRYGGALSSIRTDDLATLPIKALMERNPSVDWGSVDDVIYGCVNQAGEDNRNIARMAGLLAGLPVEVAARAITRPRRPGHATPRHAPPRLQHWQAPRNTSAGPAGRTPCPHQL